MEHLLDGCHQIKVFLFFIDLLFSSNKTRLYKTVTQKSIDRSDHIHLNHHHLTPSIKLHEYFSVDFSLKIWISS